MCKGTMQLLMHNLQKNSIQLPQDIGEGYLKHGYAQCSNMTVHIHQSCLA